MDHRAVPAAALLLLGVHGCTRAPNDGGSTSAPVAATGVAPPARSIASAPPDSDPAPVADDAGAPATGDPLAAPASQKNPSDLAWLTELISALASRPVTREQVIGYLGKDQGPSPNDSSRRRVRPHSPYLNTVEVYPLAHIKIDVAVDIEFAENSRPNRSAMEHAVGALRSMPRSPDDFSSGEKLAHYDEGAYATARVFVELDKKDPTRVAKVHVDADGVKR